MNRFVKKFFNLLFILPALIIFGAPKIEGMTNQPAQDTDRMQELVPILSTVPVQTKLPIPAPEDDQPINPLTPLRDLCNKDIDEPLLQNVFENTFYLVCEMVVQQNNPSESREWLESERTEKEFDELIMRLKEHITYTAAMKNQEPFGVEIQCFRPPFHSPIFDIIDTEVAQLCKKRDTLISVLDDVITSGQKPEYLDDAQLLLDEINSQLSWQEWWNKLPLWDKLPWDKLANAKASCLIL